MSDLFSSIKTLIKKSDGSAIKLASGHETSFSSLKVYSKQEIFEFEKKLEIKLPQEYKLFLTEIGSCRLFIDKYGLGFQFHQLEEIENHMKEVFLNRINPFPNLFLVVSLTFIGDEGGFHLNGSNKNFSVFLHDEDPEKWIQETDKWVTFFEWLNALVKSEGEKAWL